MGRRLAALPAMAILVAAAGMADALAKDKTEQALEANAQAVTLDTINVQGDAGGTVGYLATRTSTATKTDTPLRDVPQSITVVTKQQIADTGALKLEDVVRYVPGVVWHQGENNRDQIVIRGQSSTADFFVNGMRDDAQLFRDLYNAERVELLKGPNAMIFGRGGGGGVLNRVLKEADGVTRREVTALGGSFNDARVSADAGGRVNDSFAARLNAVYEQSDSYRDFTNLKRYGINPTFTWTPSAATKVTLSYEYFYDRRVQDRGVPSQNGQPYFPAGYSTFFGNPDLSYTPTTSNIVMASVDHVFDNGLKVKNQTRFQDSKKFYQNVYPNAASPVTAGGLATLAAYNNTNDRQNIINQTDWTYKANTGPIKHTLLFGTEFANQKSANARFTGFFNNLTTTITVPASNPVSFVPVTFRGLASDARNRTNLNIAAAYGQDQIELTRWLQFIGGVRFDRFDLGYVNLNGQSAAYGQTFGRIDNLVSPRAGIVLKPVEQVSLYGSYSVSYLPSSGDQFNSLTPGLVSAEPEKFVNKEIGVKWDVTPRLALTAAIYELDRTNSRFPDPVNAGFFILSGATKTRGFETSLAGYVTDQWQITAGYAYTDARVVGATSTIILPGNRVALVPYNQFSLWNRYDFTDNWGAGLGVIGTSDFYASSDDTVILPAYTRVDGAVFYKLNKHLRAQLNVENIFGTRYYPTADANNNITPGSPRAARVSITASY
ncbi:MAG: TonB-dependent siderophore receptor [Rhizobiales bacterium]|nr:TonB-dependent siderophore receptor [Hyphomicrobiales bacterium]